MSAIQWFNAACYEMCLPRLYHSRVRQTYFEEYNLISWGTLYIIPRLKDYSRYSYHGFNACPVLRQKSNHGRGQAQNSTSTRSFPNLSTICRSCWRIGSRSRHGDQHGRSVLGRPHESVRASECQFSGIEARRIRVWSNRVPSCIAISLRSLSVEHTACFMQSFSTDSLSLVCAA